MSTLAQQSLSRCDDCGEKCPLAWWGPNIRICGFCRQARNIAGRKPFTGSETNAR